MTELDQAVRIVRRAFFGIFALSGVITILMLALPFYMVQIFTRVLPSQSIETLIALSVLALIAFVLYGVFDAIRQAVLVRVGTRYEALLSGAVVYSHFLDKSRDASSGQELMNDIRTVKSFIGSRALASVSEAPFIPVFVGILFLVDVALGLLVTVGMGVMILVAILQQNTMKQHVEEQGKATRSANRVLQSHIDNAEIVRVLGLQKIAINRWGGPNSAAMTAFVNLQTAAAFYGGLSKSLRFILQAAILGVGAFLAIEGLVSPIIVFASMMIGGRALAPLDGLVGSWGIMTNAWAAHQRITDSLVGFYVDPDKTVLPDPKGDYQVERLVYGARGQNQAIIKMISFSFSAGDSVGIIGPSGAGKSTLLRLLSGAIQPTNGCVRLDGADLRNWNPMQLGQHIGYVPQAIDFLPGTVAENIARFDPEMDDALVVEAATLAGCHDIIQRFPEGYNTHLGKGAFAPSGGQKQLLAVARAFYRNPALLFFDEPNSNLDQEGDHLLMQAIAGARKRGATIAIVTQRPILLQVVDKVLILKDGQIDRYGLRSEVLPKVTKPKQIVERPVANQPAETEVSETSEMGAPQNASTSA